MILWKSFADKGGGSWKFIANLVTVENPESFRRVQPICEITAIDSREHMHAVMFCDGFPINRDVEHIIHRWYILISIRIVTELRVVLVKNTTTMHHMNNSMSLIDDILIHEYLPAPLTTPSSWIVFDNRVASVDLQK